MWELNSWNDVLGIEKEKEMDNHKVVNNGDLTGTTPLKTHGYKRTCLLGEFCANYD